MQRRFDPVKMAAKQAAQKQRKERRNVPMNELGDIVESANDVRKFLITVGRVDVGIENTHLVYQANIEAYNLVGVQPRICTAMDSDEKEAILRAVQMFFQALPPSGETPPAA